MGQTAIGGQAKQMGKLERFSQRSKRTSYPKTYTSTSLRQAKANKLYLFSDASIRAIGSVAYLKAVQPDDYVEVVFIMCKARLSQVRTYHTKARTVPRCLGS